MLYKAKLKYSRVSIFQASNLKESHAELEAEKEYVMIVLVDAINK